MIGRDFHFSSPKDGQDFRVTVFLIAAVLVAGIAANVIPIVWVLS